MNKSLLESHLWIASVTPANQHGFLKVRSMEFLTWNYHVKLFRFQGHPPPQLWTNSEFLIMSLGIYIFFKLPRGIQIHDKITLQNGLYNIELWGLRKSVC